MNERSTEQIELSACINGASIEMIHQLDLFTREYGLMVLRGEPLPPQAAGELAQVLACSRALAAKASRLRAMLTPPEVV